MVGLANNMSQLVKRLDKFMTRKDLMVR